jgi:hypothetical protein
LRLLTVCKFSYQKTEKVFKPLSQVKVAEDEAGLYLQATNPYIFAPVGQTPIVRVDAG